MQGETDSADEPQRALDSLDSSTAGGGLHSTPSLPSLQPLAPAPLSGAMARPQTLLLLAGLAVLLLTAQAQPQEDIAELCVLGPRADWGAVGVRLRAARRSASRRRRRRRSRRSLARRAALHATALTPLLPALALAFFSPVAWMLPRSRT